MSDEIIEGVTEEMPVEEGVAVGLSAEPVVTDLSPEVADIIPTVTTPEVAENI